MKYGAEWTPGIVLLGAVIVFPLAPPFALIALVIVALAVAAALVALAGVILASPYLLARSVHRHLAERHQPAKSSAPMATAIAQPVTGSPQ